MALSAHIAAYVAEIVRAGIALIRPGQSRAAFALGMSRVQTIRQIILPQALVRMLPAFGSILSVTIKDTAIAAVIAVPEYMNRCKPSPARAFARSKSSWWRWSFISSSCSPHPRRGHGVRAPGASWPVMNLDWSVVWRNAGALVDGTELTVALAVLTMLIAVPGGIVLGADAAVRMRLLTGASASFVELFCNLPLILVIYTAYYVMPIAIGVAFLRSSLVWWRCR